MNKAQALDTLNAQLDAVGCDKDFLGLAWPDAPDQYWGDQLDCTPHKVVQEKVNGFNGDAYLEFPRELVEIAIGRK
jgi:hypothetical protein